MSHIVIPQRLQNVDWSDTLTAGGSAQTIANANEGRSDFFIQNLDSAHQLWVNFGAAATQGSGSIQLAPGASFSFNGPVVDMGLVSVIGGTTGQAWTAKEW
jgi:hypothetical protein